MMKLLITILFAIFVTGILCPLKKCESAGVGQPLNLRPASIAQLIQVELLQRRLYLAQIQGASLAFFTFFERAQYSFCDKPGCPHSIC